MTVIAVCSSVVRRSSIKFVSIGFESDDVFAMQLKYVYTLLLFDVFPACFRTVFGHKSKCKSVDLKSNFDGVNSVLDDRSAFRL